MAIYLSEDMSFKPSTSPSSFPNLPSESYVISTCNGSCSGVSICSSSTSGDYSFNNEVKRNYNKNERIFPQLPPLQEDYRIRFSSEEYGDINNDTDQYLDTVPKQDRQRYDNTSVNQKAMTANELLDIQASSLSTRGEGIRSRQSYPSIISSIIDPPMPGIELLTPRLRLEKARNYLSIAALQAYTILTVVRCLAEPTWIVLTTSSDKSGGREGLELGGTIGRRERLFLGCAIVFTLLSCIGVTLRIMDRMAWLRRGPVITAYFQTAFCVAAILSFKSSHKLPPGTQYSHGFLACVITAILSTIVAIMLTIDWWRGFPSAGLSATLKALIISSFLMTAVIIIGAAIYTWLENWTFDEAVNFCIVSFSTIGYGNLNPRSVPGRILFFFYGILGVSAIGFFIVSLRNAVVEQLEWQLIEKFSKPAHMTRVQTRMSAKYLSYPMARFQEEQKVKAKVKRTMIIRMIIIWIVLWFGGAGVFCAFERWTFLESLYFCYVTLTTIGFGDYVPTEPGSIEFWNVYVFVGLTIFAYILSLFSDTIASRIHLVDDNDVDEYEDDFSVRDQHNGDFSAPHGPLPALMFSKGGGVLGLNGARWSQYHREQLRLYPFHKQQQEISEESLQPSQSSNQDRPRRRGIHLWTRQRKEQLYLQRKKSSVRVLRISAKERKQMSQAEYYANLGGHFKKSSMMVIDPEDIKNNRNSLENAPYTKSDMAATTTKFVDMHGVSRHRRVGSRYSMISAPGSTNSLSPGYKSNIQPGHQSYVYGAGYHDVMTRRRCSVVEVRTQDMPPLSPSSYSAHNIQYSTNGTNYRSTHDGEHGSILGSTTPYSSQSLYEHSHYGSPPQDQYLQTNALQHQPQVHFESPETISRGNTVSRRGASQQGSPQSRQQQDDKCLKINNSSIVITSPSQMKPNQETIIGIGEEETSSLHGPPLLLPQSKGVREGSLTTLHSPWSEQENETENKRDAFTRYLNLEHTRQSHSSDATKIGSPISYNISTDSCPGMDAFSNESGNSYLGEVIKYRVDNSPIISCKRDGIAPDEIPPYEFSNALLTLPNSRPSQSIFNSALDQSWKSIVKDDASNLEPIWEQKTEHQ